jgi:hypothetical protein
MGPVGSTATRRGRWPLGVIGRHSGTPSHVRYTAEADKHELGGQNTTGSTNVIIPICPRAIHPLRHRPHLQHTSSAAGCISAAASRARQHAALLKVFCIEDFGYAVMSAMNFLGAVITMVNVRPSN